MLFWIEVPLSLGAVAYWTFAPTTFLEQAIGGSDQLKAHAVPVLRGYAGVVFSMVAWLYVRFLCERRLDVRSFCLFQEALLIGDVWIVATQATHMPVDAALRSNAWLTCALAGFWGIVRLAYLVGAKWGRSDHARG